MQGAAWSFGGLFVWVLGTSCLSPGARELDSVAAPSEPELPGATSAVHGMASASAHVEAPPPSPSLPEEEPAASVFPERLRIVSAQVQPGLADFANELDEAGLSWVGPLAGNGGRDVLVYMPPSPEPSAKVRLVYHFHGTHSQHVEKKRPNLAKKKWVGWNRLEQTLEAATELQQRNEYNVVLVYPFSAGKRREPGAQGWWNGEYDRMWMKSADSAEYSDAFDTLHEEVQAILREHFGVHPSRFEHSVIAEGHSAGGIALRNIAESGTAVVGEYLFQDASFQTWADGCHAALEQRKSSARVTLVITTKGIADPLAGRDPWCIRLESAAELWMQHQDWCASKMDRVPAGAAASCTELATDAESWKEFASWCENMKTEMRDVPGVHVHRTRIVHGKQPRHFTGGLDLPDTWHQGLLPSTR